MSTDRSYIIFYVIMFVLESQKTSGMSLKKGFQLESKDSSGDLPVLYGDWKNEDYDVMTTRRKKEVAGNVVNEEKLNHMKMLFEKLYKYKNFGKPRTSNALMSNGWGAGGMPFNVLYTPNSHQQKILKFVPKENLKQSPRRENDLAYETRDSQRRKDECEQKQQQQQQRQHVMPRKYFSVIPQLFASYGWRTHY